MRPRNASGPTCWIVRTTVPAGLSSSSDPPVTEATITVCPPIFAIEASWPGPMNGSVSWMMPGIATGQPGSSLPLAPSIAYRRPLVPAAAEVHFGKADVAAVAHRAVDLVARDYDVVVAGVVQVGDRRLVDRLGDHRFPGRCFDRVDERNRVALDGFAVCLPGVQVPVEARLDDVRFLGEAFEMRDRRRREEAALRMAVVGLQRRRAQRRVGGHREMGDRLAVGVPRVDVRSGRGDHVLAAVAGEVGDHWRRAEPRAAGPAPPARASPECPSADCCTSVCTGQPFSSLPSGS